MRIIWFVTILLIGELFGACSSQTDVLTLKQPASTPTPTPTSAPAPIPTPGPNEVWIQGDDYRPNVITVPVGTTVTWTGKDNDAQHDVDSDNDLFFSSLAMGASFSYTFAERGTFHYSCGCAPGMAGTVIVE